MVQQGWPYSGQPSACLCPQDARLDQSTAVDECVVRMVA